jgi:hypothetical protein
MFTRRSKPGGKSPLIADVLSGRSTGFPFRSLTVRPIGTRGRRQAEPQTWRRTIVAEPPRTSIASASCGPMHVGRRSVDAAAGAGDGARYGFPTVGSRRLGEGRSASTVPTTKTEMTAVTITQVSRPRNAPTVRRSCTQRFVPRSRPPPRAGEEPSSTNGCEWAHRPAKRFVGRPGEMRAQASGPGFLDGGGVQGFRRTFPNVSRFSISR